MRKRYCAGGWGYVDMPEQFEQKVANASTYMQKQETATCPTCDGQGYCICSTCIDLEKRGGSRGRCLTCWGLGRLTLDRLALMMQRRLRLR